MEMTAHARYLTLLALYAPLVAGQDTEDEEKKKCTGDNLPLNCLPEWWRGVNHWKLAGAAVLVFFATFLPRVLLRLVIFVLTKLPFIAQTAEDFREHCSVSSANLISASLVLIALSISDLDKFFNHLLNYIWGAFFIVWLYTLFNVVESLAIRRFVGVNGDFSKRVVISESIKILRLTTLLIIALIIYSSAVGEQELLKYSVLVVIGLAIALGFVPSFHNVVGGLLLAFNSQFRIDDFIQVGDAQGFVHRVSLRFTTIVTMEGTKVYIPNSFFLFKPMVNYSQRPKRDIDIRIRVAPATSVEQLRQSVSRLEAMLQSLHMGLTSHEENRSDLRHNEKWEHFYFVAMEELYEIRVYSYTDELDERKYAMIRSEVWLAIMEIMEELKIEVLNDGGGGMIPSNPRAQTTTASTAEKAFEAPFTAEMNVFTGAGPRTSL
ncbi:hypothetical protein Poli38472_003245 [Pythium oligandrum]|uniref:Mechanosensitive ion channel MscS domain-containing protein n=1 Tax=Pythium oligandrum TaxID=41045 RepID=A0A8K1C6N8_PYTOL|nr:hypothetical protein Poli38472_003245 [Pythium oligandrum]|eukprot:TMW57320.1 hypothetical protein Poli38472_003245 [Pythium oligandrum]